MATNISAIGNVITAGISSLGDAVAKVFTVTETGKTNRTQLETDAQKYGSDSQYASSLATQQGKTIRVIIIALTVLILGWLGINFIKK